MGNTPIGGCTNLTMSHTDTAKQERDELIAWIVLADKPDKPASFLSTKTLIAERKRFRFALECALDYAHHMAPEDYARVRATYDSVDFDGHVSMTFEVKPPK